MQFVKNGPDIPEHLLQLHEEGSVVFFCGAGISYPAGLPGFGALVDGVYSALGESNSALEAAALKSWRYDTALGLLESRVAGGRDSVREAVAEILTPNLSRPRATATHEALLTLARNREGTTRLVTTNFDRIFEEVISSASMRVTRFHAPLLPVPKRRWEGIAYLHGLMTGNPQDLGNLVLSSGDFGLAYLAERWASRFVTELFRNYTVCFVGYSIEDPVLRYMMDALAADQQLGESLPEMFAFGEYRKGKKEEAAGVWGAKNVTPILYRSRSDHCYLHATLRTWSETYRDGVTGRERIVVEHGSARPQASTREDHFVGRMLWALSHSSGLPARRFADLNPVPLLDWLEPLSENCHGRRDFRRFGVHHTPDANHQVAFSTVFRPAPYFLAPWMALSDNGDWSGRWDEVMSHIARWLTRHLDDPKLVLWLLKQGGRLHERLKGEIERTLDHLATLQRENRYDDLERIRSNAPRSVPRPVMRTIWSLLLAERVRGARPRADPYRFLRRLDRDGVTPSLRIQLREVLAPVVQLREPTRWHEAFGEPPDEDDIRSAFDWEVVIVCDHAHSAFGERLEQPSWTAALPSLLDDLLILLRDAMELMAGLGGANNKSDLSIVHQPSITPHPQNRGFRDWTVLVDLVRDSWLAVAVQDPERARMVAERWILGPYPIYRRLAFFAATQDRIIPPSKSLDWLVTDDGCWLWSAATRREAMRLLVKLGPQLDAPALARLERVVLDGPPMESTPGDSETERKRWADRAVWLRLSKLDAASVSLSEEASLRLETIGAEHPEWELQPGDRDEFVTWMSEGQDLGTHIATPVRPRELVEWLTKHPLEQDGEEDEWQERCRNRPLSCVTALCSLAKEDIWFASRWEQALYVWSKEELLAKIWRRLPPLLASASNDFLASIRRALSWWLKSVSKTFEHHESHFFELCRRVLSFEYVAPDPDSDSEPVMAAINHPVGHVTQAMLNWWFRRELQDGQRLPDELRQIFTRLVKVDVTVFRNSRVLLASHCLALYRVDQDWAASHLLPLFDWNASRAEALAAWAGFLWSPRIHHPLLSAIRTPLLETARHFDELGEHKNQYATFLTYVALDNRDVFTQPELHNAIGDLPQDGANAAADALARAMESAGDQREEYWSNRIRPFWKKVWPKDRDRASRSIAGSVARVCIAAGPSFLNALETTKAWLKPVEHPDYVVSLLQESGLSSQFPEGCLLFLDALIDYQAWAPRQLGECLREIATADVALASDPRHIRLREYSEQAGLE